MAFYDAVADLPLRIDGWDRKRRRAETSSDFERVTTTFVAAGDGEQGRGEDVTYDAEDHDRLAETSPNLPIGSFTFDEFSGTLDGVALFPGEGPERESSRHYRRWGVESAGLDLALRQADASLADALDREYDPVRFVASMRLGDPPTTDRADRLLDRDAGLEFKLDPTPSWDRDLIADLAATDAVRILDLKGHYEGTDVDGDADPGLYRRVVGGFPDALIEDPALTAETRALLQGNEDRISWDAPVTGVDSVRELPREPSWINVKPSRFGTVRSLFATVEHCLDRGIDLYGGGQFELGVGRQHLHAVASLFYPDGPNDVAPSIYNRPEIPEAPPTSPLSPPDDPRGLSWE